MNYTSSIGSTTELECIAAFIKMGYDCSIPYGNSAKYDFIVDTGENLYRIQCKSSQVYGGTEESPESFVFNTIRRTTNTKNTTVYNYSNKDVDFFATVFQGKVYIFPIDFCSNCTSRIIRLTPTKCGIKKGTHPAEDFEIEKFFKPAEDYLNTKDAYLNRKTTNKFIQDKNK